MTENIGLFEDTLETKTTPKETKKKTTKAKTEKKETYFFSKANQDSTLIGIQGMAQAVKISQILPTSFNDEGKPIPEELTKDKLIQKLVEKGFDLYKAKSMVHITPLDDDNETVNYAISFQAKSKG